MLIILAHNKTGTKADGTSDYDVTIRVNDRIVTQFEVLGHKRDSGWQPLVAEIAKGR